MSDGMNYAPVARQQQIVCQPGEFKVGVAHLDHGHIYGMAENLKQAGATIAKVYDRHDKRIEYFCKLFPEAEVVGSFAELLEDPSLHMIAAAAVPSLRGAIGVEVMQHGKDYFTDKTPFTNLEQLQTAKQVAADSGRKYMCCYSERVQNEAAEYAVELIQKNVIGDVVQVLGLGPHRLNATQRPKWFFEKAKYGGIICDIGSHQAEQFLTFTGAEDAQVTQARVHNYGNPEYPELEDFGDFSLLGNNQASGYFRMDWFTPDGLRTWGDGRTTILGTKGYIELRKYVDVAQPEMTTDNVYVVTQEGEEKHHVAGKIGFPFFPALILDCLNRTENAMTQSHCFKAAEICLQAQALAEKNP
jgi:predicted dehydrogenase